MATFTPNFELKQHNINDPIDPVDAFASNFGKVSSLYQDGNVISNGVAVCDRRFTNGTITPVSGEMHFSYFTSARGSLSGGIITKAELRLGGQTGSGLTLARIGLYTVAAGDQALTLVASTANDTAGWTSTFSGVSKNLAAAYTLQVGKRYALGILFTGTTPPSFLKYAGSTDFALNAVPPRICGKLTAQVDLPASLADSALSTTSGGPYITLLP